MLKLTKTIIELTNMLMNDYRGGCEVFANNGCGYTKNYHPCEDPKTRRPCSCRCEKPAIKRQFHSITDFRSTGGLLYRGNYSIRMCDDCYRNAQICQVEEKLDSAI